MWGSSAPNGTAQVVCHIGLSRPVKFLEQMGFGIGASLGTAELKTNGSSGLSASTPWCGQKTGARWNSVPQSVHSQSSVSGTSTHQIPIDWMAVHVVNVASCIPIDDLFRGSPRGKQTNIQTLGKNVGFWFRQGFGWKNRPSNLSSSFGWNVAARVSSNRPGALPEIQWMVLCGHATSSSE